MKPSLPNSPQPLLQILERCQFCYRLTQKLRKNAVIKRAGVALQPAELVAELKRQERKLHKSLGQL